MSKDKVQPRIMPGFMELLPEDQIAFNRMYDTIRRVYERYGFLPLDTACRLRAMWRSTATSCPSPSSAIK